MKFVLIVLVAGLALVEPHAHISVPLARTSIFRRPNEFPGAQQPFWWDDNGVSYKNNFYLSFEGRQLTTILVS